MSRQYIPKILIIDDIKENLMALQGNLRGLDAEIFTVTSGHEALIQVKQHDFALIIADIQMPEMNGYETVERIRSERRNKHTPVIFLTAVYFDQASMFKGYQTGAVDYITKPFQREILLSKARIFLDLDRVKQELSESKKQFQDVVQDQTDMICRTDRKLNITFANRAMLMGFAINYDSLMGQNLLGWLNPKDSNELKTSLENLNPNHAVIKQHHTLKLSDSRQMWVSTVARALFDKNYQPVGFQLVMRDISNEVKSRKELIKAREKAEAATKSKSMFLANMSHEIRTPINSILGMIDVLMETEVNEDQMEDLEVIQYSAKKLLGLLNDLLDFSKIEANQIKLEKIYFNLHDELGKIIRLQEIKAKEKDNKLVLNIAENVPERIQGDSLRLGQILINLVNNALKFTEGGTVELKAEVESETEDQVRIRFSVSDTGIGMDKQARDIIFEFFEQGDPSVTREYGGTGLGLAISKSLCEMMGGKINLESEINKGTTFWIEIDFDREKPKKNTNNDRMKVLIVEDNLLNQKVVSATLRKNGYDFDLADNGKIAVEKAAKTPFDIIIMDIQMPVMDGYDATRLIRENEEKQPGDHRAKIIALTANATKEDRKKCMEIGMDEYMTKPFKFKELEQIIRKLTD